MQAVPGRCSPARVAGPGPATVRLVMHGLSVLSEIDLPFHRQTGRRAGIDVRIVEGEVPVHGELVWEAAVPPRCRCLRDGGRITLAWEDARFAVTADRIVVDGDDSDLTRQLLAHPVWAALLAARGRQALHACAVARDGHGLAVAGGAGSGKSTAALSLIDAGWALVADDLLAFDAQGRALPGPAIVHLRPDRAAGRDGQWDDLGRLRYVAPARSSPVPVRTLVLLDAQFGALRPLHGLEAIEGVLRHIYHPIPTYPGQSRQCLDFAMSLVTRMDVLGAAPRSLSPDELVRIAGMGVAP